MLSFPGLARASQCPACQTEVNPSAAVCPSCKVELAICNWCMDMTTLRQAQPQDSWIPERQRYTCDRCGRLGARCRTNVIGGYCNALARADGRFGRQLCAGCTKSIFDFSKTGAAWTLIGLVVGLLRGRK